MTAIRDLGIGAVHDHDEASTARCSHFVSVVIPCLNEERTIATCVRKAFAGLRDAGFAGEVLVSDNGSIDASRRCALDAGARVVHCQTPGYGSAVSYGVSQARGDLIIMADGDDSYDLKTIGSFIRGLLAGSDLVMGNRFKGGILPGAMPWKNRYVGNPILTGLLNLLFHANVGDAHCGLRSFTRAAFQRIAPCCPGMEFASELVVRAALLRLQILEVPTTLSPDGRGRPPHLSPWRDGWRHLNYLIGAYFRIAYRKIATRLHRVARTTDATRKAPNALTERDSC